MVFLIIFFLRQNTGSASSATVVAKEDGTNSKAIIDNKVDTEIKNIKQEIAGGKGNSVSADTSKSTKNKVDDKEPEVKPFDPEIEYKRILSISPMIVFSKSYCPYSQRLKNLFANEYEFQPIYKVIELDKHENGAELQRYIGTKTGRSTVPNVMINGVSRGGCDDFLQLHEEKTLLDHFKKWSGSKISIEKVTVPSNS